MIQVLEGTILPIFAIIVLGGLLKTRHVIRDDAARVLNQMVYYVAIPAMLVVKLSHMSFRTSFQPTVLICVIGTLLLIWAVAVGLSFLLISRRQSRATFIQSSIHGNVGYMGYAIAFFTLGDKAFAQAAILGGFLMIAQNLLAVFSFSFQGSSRSSDEVIRSVLAGILRNPVILSALAGMAISVSGISLPEPLFKMLSILSGMSFPLALLLIGASLSFSSARSMIFELIGIGAIKLLVLPVAGYLLMSLAHLSHQAQLPALILLASPPATVSYVFASELNGDPELAAAGISIHTLLCAVSYSALLYLPG